MAASKLTDIHTHFRNAVLLVWGSLRLAPIIANNSSPNSQEFTDITLNKAAIMYHKLQGVCQARNVG